MTRCGQDAGTARPRGATREERRERGDGISQDYGKERAWRIKNINVEQVLYAGIGNPDDMIADLAQAFDEAERKMGGPTDDRKESGL